MDLIPTDWSRLFFTCIWVKFCCNQFLWEESFWSNASIYFVSSSFSSATFRLLSDFQWTRRKPFTLQLKSTYNKWKALLVLSNTEVIIILYYLAEHKDISVNMIYRCWNESKEWIRKESRKDIQAYGVLPKVLGTYRRKVWLKNINYIIKKIVISWRNHCERS